MISLPWEVDEIAPHDTNEPDGFSFNFRSTELASWDVVSVVEVYDTSD